MLVVELEREAPHEEAAQHDDVGLVVLEEQHAARVAVDLGAEGERERPSRRRAQLERQRLLVASEIRGMSPFSGSSCRSREPRQSIPPS